MDYFSHYLQQLTNTKEKKAEALKARQEINKTRAKASKKQAEALELLAKACKQEAETFEQIAKQEHTQEKKQQAKR